MFVCVWAAEEEWRGSGEAGRRLGECAQLLACVVVELRDMDGQESSRFAF